MRGTLYIDLGAKIGSSFSQERKEYPRARMRRAQRHPLPNGTAMRGRKRESWKEYDDLWYRQLRNIRAQAYIYIYIYIQYICENDKSTGKAARNLDKISRLALLPVPLFASRPRASSLNSSARPEVV